MLPAVLALSLIWVEALRPSRLPLSVATPPSVALEFTIFGVHLLHAHAPLSEFLLEL